MAFEVENKSDIEAMINRAEKKARDLLQPGGFEKSESLDWQSWKKLDKPLTAFDEALKEYKTLKKEKDVDNSEKITDCVKQMDNALTGYLKKYQQRKNDNDYLNEGAKMGKILLNLISEENLNNTRNNRPNNTRNNPL